MLLYKCVYKQLFCTRYFKAAFSQSSPLAGCGKLILNFILQGTSARHCRRPEGHKKVQCMGAILKLVRLEAMHAHKPGAAQSGCK